MPTLHEVPIHSKHNMPTFFQATPTLREVADEANGIPAMRAKVDVTVQQSKGKLQEAAKNGQYEVLAMEEPDDLAICEIMEVFARSMSTYRGASLVFHHDHGCYGPTETSTPPLCTLTWKFK